MRKIFLIMIITLITATSFATVRIRDLADVSGIRENQLVGYGLVMGLNGTGDKSGTKFTIQSLVNMMERMGVTVDKDQVKVKNVAAVMVTAKLPPFAKPGTKINVVVSSLGDAKSLEGGTLMMTPLTAANGKTYAVAQGPLSVGGMNVSSGGAGATKNHPTAGMIPNGAIVEREVPFQLADNGFNLAFKDYSIKNIVRAKNAINDYFKSEIAAIDSPSTLKIDVPKEQRENFYEFLDQVLSLNIQPDNFAKIVVDERTGTIVMGSDVRISTVAVSHGNLTINISSTVEVTDDPLGESTTTETTNVTIEEEPSKLMVIPQGVSISDLVKALNAIGVTPRDLISILQAIKTAGALHGDLEVM